MNIQRDDRHAVVIRARRHKAQDLLDGLIAHRDELGALGEELEHMLRAAGVEPSTRTERIRHEYMPPLRS
ncbi:MAG: hypothetical protein PVI15_08805 [Chromatiales bacterium]|jgi:hypothetical protein